MGGEFTTNVTGWFFLVGALLFWGGQVLLPRRVGMFFQSDDFQAIGAHLHLWLWLYRIHLFGMVVTALALVALAALVANQPAVRILVWPGVALAKIQRRSGGCEVFSAGLRSPALRQAGMPDRHFQSHPSASCI